MAPAALVAVGLVGALASAAIIGAFESQLEERVLLAFFIPGVVYMAAATFGTQTQAVLIRGFSVGVAMGQVLRREVASGAVLSLVLSAVLLPIALVGWATEVALGVALALFASSLVSTLVAIAIPLGFQRLGKDTGFSDPVRSRQSSKTC